MPVQLASLSLALLLAAPVAAAPPPAAAPASQPAIMNSVVTAPVNPSSTAATPAVAPAEAPAATVAVADPVPAVVSAMPVAPPSPVLAAAPRPKPMPKSGLPLLITGASITATIYLGTAFAGAQIIDESRNDSSGSGGDNPLTAQNEAAGTGGSSQRRKYGNALLIPVAGPIIAMRYSDSAVKNFGLALNATMQVAGVVMTVAGIAMQRRRRRTRRWGIAAAPAQDGGNVVVQGRF